MADEVKPMMDSSRWGRTENLFRRQNVNGRFGCLLINPQNGWCKAWEKFILVLAIFSLLFTPFELGFFRGLPHNLFVLDIVVQSAFLLDVFLQFLVTHQDSHSYKIVFNCNLIISLRYLKFFFIPDLLSCVPWHIIYKVVGRKEGVRHLLLIKLIRLRKVVNFFRGMEKNIEISFLFTRIVELIVTQLYFAHIAACTFYYLATTISPAEEDKTWIGSLTLGNYSYKGFREIDLGRRYTTSLYLAYATMTTVGYGDVHPVNMREMIFFMSYISIVLIVDVYLFGNVAAQLVKGSEIERYRDKLAGIVKLMNRNGIRKDIQNQVKEHMRLQYENTYDDARVLKDIPSSIRTKLRKTLYESHVKSIPLFKDCSSQFINKIVTHIHDEYFLPGEVIMDQGDAVDHLYFVFHGFLEEVLIGADGSEEHVSLLEHKSFFGEISVLCNIPQPFTVRVLDVCRLLRINKKSLSNILELYSHDKRNILANLREVKESNVRVNQLEQTITFLIEKIEMEMALRVNVAAYYGHLDQLKSLIESGADPNKKDYDERSPLHIAASRGYDDITIFLLQRGANINAKDKFGNTPLLEAVKGGHDSVASILFHKSASLKIDNPGSYLCALVEREDSDLLRRVLQYDISSNSTNYDNRTPLHVAAFKGSYEMAKVLLDAAANIHSLDRFGATPISEADLSQNNSVIKLLEDARKIHP